MLQKNTNVRRVNPWNPSLFLIRDSFVVFLLLLFVPGGVLRAQTTSRTAEQTTVNFMALSEEIASLRTQVEIAHNNLQEARKLNSARIHSLHMQEADLAAEREREELLNRKLLNQSLELHKDETSIVQRQSELDSVARWVFTTHKEYLESSLPFRREDRSAGAVRNWKMYEDGKISVDQYLLRTLNALTDESRMTRGILLQSGEVWIGEKRFQAELIKLGSLALFFRTTDGQYGYAEAGASREWKFVLENDRHFVESVEELRQGLKKQIRNGIYKIPTVAINLVGGQRQ